MATSTEEKILERLGQIVNLLALLIASDRNTVTDAARSLKMAGLDNMTIAEILNINVTTVRTLTSNLRGKSSRKAKGSS